MWSGSSFGGVACWWNLHYLVFWAGAGAGRVVVKGTSRVIPTQKHQAGGGGVLGAFHLHTWDAHTMGLTSFLSPTLLGSTALE